MRDLFSIEGAGGGQHTGEHLIIDRRADGSPISATVQGSCCGNSVCPPVAEAIVAANCGHLARVREAAE